MRTVKSPQYTLKCKSWHCISSYSWCYRVEYDLRNAFFQSLYFPLAKLFTVSGKPSFYSSSDKNLLLTKLGCVAPAQKARLWTVRLFPWRKYFTTKWCHAERMTESTQNRLPPWMASEGMLYRKERMGMCRSRKFIHSQVWGVQGGVVVLIIKTLILFLE